MSDVRKILERGVAGFEPVPDALDRTLVRVRHRGRVRRLGAAGAAVLVAGGLVAGLWTAFRPGGPPPPIRPTLAAGVLGGHIVGGPPLALGYGSVWVLTCDRLCGNDQREASGRLVRIDPDTEQVVASVPIEQGQAVAAGEGGVWVIDFWHGNVTRVDPNTNQVVATIPLRLPFPVCESCPGAHDFLPFNLTTGAGAVWVITDRGAVARIDPQTNQVAAYIRTAPEGGGSVGVARGRLWVTNGLFGVWAIDPATGSVVDKIPILDGPHLVQAGILEAGGRLWAGGGDTRKTGDPANPYVSARGGAVARIDPATGEVTDVIHFDHSAFVTAADEDAAWVLAGPPGGNPDYYRIDTQTDEVSGPFSLGGMLWAVDQGWGWVVTGEDTIERVALPTGTP